MKFGLGNTETRVGDQLNRAVTFALAIGCALHASYFSREEILPIAAASLEAGRRSVGTWPSVRWPQLGQ